MTKSHFIPSVLQALVLSALSDVVLHHLLDNAWSDAQNNETWANFTRAIDTLSSNATTTLNGTATFNSTIGSENLNTTTGTGGNGISDEPFYTRTFPQSLFISLVIFILDYYWQIWLEKSLPGRARPTVPTTTEKQPLMDEMEGSEAHEEALIQRLISQGKIKRSSLSWWNTFLKWTIDMTLGQIWKDGIIAVLLEGLMELSSPKTIFQSIKWGLLYRPWIPYLSFHPLASLLSFIIIPAHKRIVFLAGVDLLWSVFVGTFVGILLPWLSKTAFVEGLVANVTGEASKHSQRMQQNSTAPVLMEIGGPDEL